MRLTRQPNGVTKTGGYATQHQQQLHDNAAQCTCLGKTTIETIKLSWVNLMKELPRMYLDLAPYNAEADP